VCEDRGRRRCSEPEDRRQNVLFLNLNYEFSSIFDAFVVEG
jgi:hypothetical protein